MEMRDDLLVAKYKCYITVMNLSSPIIEHGNFEVDIHTYFVPSLAIPG
jgi:hypothetical protein